MKFKKIVSMSLIAISLMTVPVFGEDMYTVYNLSEKSMLSRGISYERIEKFTSQGWMNVNVVRADLTDEYTEIKPLSSEKGVSNRAPLSSMIKSNGAVAGVNGDFFLTKDPTYAYGALIDNGKLLTSPLPMSYGYPTISRTVEGSIDISVWNPKITMYGTDGTAFDIVVYNKTSSLDYGATILTSDWNNMSIGYKDNKNIVEVVVKDDYVSEVRVNQPSAIIPTNGYIIASSSPTTMQQLQNSFSIGMPVILDIQFDFSPENLEWAFGGLNHVLKDGVVHNISKETLGTHPRTAIGFNKDKTEMILVTIDGRNKNYVGVTQTELAQIMLELGAHNAVNMDGGGSTTMGIDFLKNSNISVVNYPSDGRERNIASGVGVFNTAPESNVASTIEVVLSDDKVFSNTELPLSVKVFNEYFTEIALDKNSITYDVSPSTAGTVQNHIFKPTGSGTATITANYGSLSAKANVEILDKPVSLNFNVDELVMDYGETFAFKNIVGVDKSGNSAYIPSNYINYAYRNHIGTVTDGVFTAGDISNTGAITATFGDAIKHISVKVGYRLKTLNGFEDLNNISLKLYPENSLGSIELTEQYVKEGSKSLKLNYDFTKMTDQSIAFIEFAEDGKEGIKLEGAPKAIGMWVYGDDMDHWLRARITDAKGTQHKLTFADEVNWTGWQWVTAKIPDGVAYPVTLNNIYLAEINETLANKGTAYFDNLRIMYEPNDKDLGLKPESVFSDYMSVQTVADFTEKLVISKDKSKISSPSGSEIANSSQNITYINGYITNGTLSSSNKSMWNNIKNMVNFKDKVLVLSLNADLNSLYDKREIKVLKDILEKAASNNQVFVIWEGKEQNTDIDNGIRYITYKDTFELGVTGSGVQYKN